MPLPTIFLRIDTKSEQGEGVVPRPARSPKCGHDTRQTALIQPPDTPLLEV